MITLQAVGIVLYLVGGIAWVGYGWHQDRTVAPKLLTLAAGLCPWQRALFWGLIAVASVVDTVTWPFALRAHHDR